MNRVTENGPIDDGLRWIREEFSRSTPRLGDKPSPDTSSLAMSGQLGNKMPESIPPYYSTDGHGWPTYWQPTDSLVNANLPLLDASKITVKSE